MDTAQPSRIVATQVTYAHACNLSREWAWLLQQPVEEQMAIVLSAAHGRIPASAWKHKLFYNARDLHSFWYLSYIPGLLLEARQALSTPSTLRSVWMAKDWYWWSGGADESKFDVHQMYHDHIVQPNLEPALERLRHGLRLCCP